MAASVGRTRAWVRKGLTCNWTTFCAVLIFFLPWRVGWFFFKLKLKAIWSYLRLHKILQLWGILLFLFFHLFILYGWKTDSGIEAGRGRATAFLLTYFTFSCQLRPTGQGWQTPVTGHGELWNRTRCWKKWELSPREGRASGKTKSSQLEEKKITGDRDGKQNPKGLAGVWNENTSSIYTLDPITVNTNQSKPSITALLFLQHNINLIYYSCNYI